VPTEPFAVPIVRPELDEAAVGLEYFEPYPADELGLDVGELPPHAARRSVTPSAVGMRSLLSESMARYS
jgi:hypothetical protein